MPSRRKKKSHRPLSKKRSIRKKLSTYKKRLNTRLLLEPSEPPGLLIGGKLITSFSEPISLHVLKPTKEFIEEQRKYGLYAPILIMFGDLHSSITDDQRCQSCTCNQGDIKCCMNVTSKEWLEILNNIRTKDNTTHIDLYTEVAPVFATQEKEVSDKMFAFKTNKMFHEVVRTAQKCFGRDASTLAQHSECPFSNIHFHFSDPRGQKEYDSRLRKNKEPLKYYLEMIILEFAEGDFSRVIRYSSNDTITDVEEVFKSIQTEARKILSLKDLSSKDKIKKIFVDLLFDSPYFGGSKNKSLIYKQLSKCKGKMGTIEFWREYANRYFDHYASTYHSTDDWRTKKKIIYDTILQDLNNPNKWDQTSIANRSSMQTNSSRFVAPFYLDIYMMARSFKQPDSLDEHKHIFNPYMVLTYQGSYHSQANSLLLSQTINGIQLYETPIVEIETMPVLTTEETFDYNKLNRCIQLDKRVDVDSMIQEVTSVF